MISKKNKVDKSKIIKEAVRILKISGIDDDSKATYERAKDILDQIDSAMLMLLIELKDFKTKQNA